MSEDKGLQHTSGADRAKGFLQLLLIVGFIVGSFMVSNALKTNKSLPQVKASDAKRVVVATQQISPEDYRVNFSVTALVESPSELQLTPEVSGRVVRVNSAARSGANFKAGMPLFQIESRDYELLVTQRESELAQAKTALALEEAESASAVKEWKVLHGIKPIPELVSRTPQLAQAKAAVTSAKAALENAKGDLVRTSFLFPFDGVVVSSNIVEGQYVQAGQSYGTAYNRENLQVRATLDAEKLNWMLGNDNAVAELEVEYLGKTHKRSVTPRTGDVFADTTTRFTPVYFDIEKRDDFLFSGQLAKVHMKGPVYSGVLILPVGALQSDGKVWKYAEGKVTSFTPNILYRDRNHVAVRGINGPIHVVTSRLSGGIENMSVDVLSEGN